ncbi:MAG TPA: hypothetical protein VGD14_05865 [bacterium]|jgi:hypothetical protein
MAVESLLGFRLSDRLDVFFQIFRGNKVSPIIDKLDNHAVSALQNFMWEKTVEFGIICRSKKFDRKEITRKMTPTANYQRQQGCNERAYYCKGTYCIQINPNCARKKIKEHVDIMAETMQEYFRIAKQREIV